jgi:hypothetical protein
VEFRLKRGGVAGSKDVSSHQLTKELRFFVGLIDFKRLPVNGHKRPMLLFLQCLSVLACSINCRDSSSIEKHYVIFCDATRWAATEF